MARRRRRRTRKSTTIALNRWKVAAILISIGALFFFAYFMADSSPIYTALSYPTKQAFGMQGSFVFYGLMLLIGGLILISKKYYTKGLFKFGVVALFIICGILNFSLLDAGFTTSINGATRDMIVNGGGWLGYGVLRGVDYLFGGQVMAIKIFMIALFIGVAIAIGLYFKIKLPSIKIQNVADRYESAKKAIKKSKSTSSSKASASATSNDTDEKKKKATKQTVKSLLKDKLTQTVQQKEDLKTLKDLHVAFPSDKPSFSINKVLTPGEDSGPNITEKWLIDKAEAIRKKLLEFNIDVSVKGFNVGPTVVQFKLSPESGIKISKIESYQKDIALALKTKALRIMAPIPGTDNVGIEIPNPKPQMVRLSETLGSVEFTKSIKDNLTNLAIGKGIDGKHVVKPLDSMPHLLVAGATGSGKSVGVNDFISSLIYQNTPSELKFIMVDPKQVELSIYEGLPYLLSPIITQAGKAVKVLKWAVEFMDQRYRKLKESKARNLHEYNEKVDDKEQMYRLVIIIDELADLMMSGNKKDTENYITRIAQKARAVGIHLILATQRPSVNVITGIIKANIPTRIAFAVVSQIDSRTILDMKGAEDLVGKGDLLYSSPEYKFPIRVQAPFISTGETEDLVTAIKKKYMDGVDENDIYHPEIIRILENKGEYATSASSNLSEDDEDMIAKALELIVEKQKASATMLQRSLGIGFPRAARLLDALEKRGFVGPQEGSKPREILI